MIFAKKSAILEFMQHELPRVDLRFQLPQHELFAPQTFDPDVEADIATASTEAGKAFDAAALARYDEAITARLNDPAYTDAQTSLINGVRLVATTPDISKTQRAREQMRALTSAEALKVIGTIEVLGQEIINSMGTPAAVAADHASGYANHRGLVQYLRSERGRLSVSAALASLDQQDTRAARTGNIVENQLIRAADKRLEVVKQHVHRLVEAAHQITEAALASKDSRAKLTAAGQGIEAILVVFDEPFGHNGQERNLVNGTLFADADLDLLHQDAGRLRAKLTELSA